MFGKEEQESFSCPLTLLFLYKLLWYTVDPCTCILYSVKHAVCSLTFCTSIFLLQLYGCCAMPFVVYCCKEVGIQEAFEKCWAHSPLRAASRPLTRCRQRYCRALPAHRCPQHRQRQHVTEGTAMAPWNGPNHGLVVKVPCSECGCGVFGGCVFEYCQYIGVYW